jgi:hypothetical protein
MLPNQIEPATVEGEEAIATVPNGSVDHPVHLAHESMAHEHEDCHHQHKVAEALLEMFAIDKAGY